MGGFGGDLPSDPPLDPIVRRPLPPSHQPVPSPTLSSNLMATASLSFQITATVDDQPVAFPQTGVSAPTQITYTSNLTMLKYEQVAASGAVLKTLFDPTEEMFAAGGSAGDFDLMVILSDQDIWLEIRGTGADDNSAIHVKANVPFILGSVSTRDYNAAGDFAGTILPMTAIKAKNLGATVANVWVFAVT